MSRILHLILLLTSVGFLLADSEELPCPDVDESNQYWKDFRKLAHAENDIFTAASGPRESKYELYKATWTNIRVISKNHYEKTYPVHCFPADIILDLTAKPFRWTKFLIDTTENEYLAFTDPKLIKKVEKKASEIDNCYEGSRTLTKSSKDIDFCSYKMPQALECAKDLFKDDSDSPLAALEGYTNKLVKEFDCKGHDYEHYTKIVDFYNSDAKTKLATGRQSFFHGYQQVAKAFLKTA